VRGNVCILNSGILLIPISAPYGSVLATGGPERSQVQMLVLMTATVIENIL
jgi:hypothetical protein